MKQSLKFLLLMTLILNNSFNAKSQVYQVLDSIPLFDNNRYFNYSFPLKNNNDTILAFSYPRLDLSFINNKGVFLSKITQKGQAPGYLGNSEFIDVQTDELNNIYVLTQDYSYSLFIYNHKGNYLGKVRLFQHLSNVSPETFYSSFVVSSTPESKTIILTLSTSSTRYSPYNKETYNKEYQLAQFEINRETMTVLNTTQKLPLNSEPEIINSLSTNSINWYRPTSVFDICDGKAYKASMFSRKIHIYDSLFSKKLGEVTLETLPRLKKPFTVGFSDRRSKDIMTRTTQEHKLLYENVNIWNIRCSNNTILAQLTQPQESGKHVVPSMQELQNGWTATYPTLIIIKNLTNNQERLITLDKRFQGKAHLIDKEHFLIQGSPSLNSDDIYLYKIRIPLL